MAFFHNFIDNLLMLTLKSYYIYIYIFMLYSLNRMKK